MALKTRNSGGSGHRSVKSRTELGFPVWKLQKRRDGYSVNILGRNTKKPRDTTPFSAHCEVMSQRKRRSQQRLEAFIEKKKVQKLQDSFCKVSDAGTPAGCDGGHGAKLSSDLVPNDSQAAPTIACCVDIQQSSTPQDIFCEVKDAGTVAGNDGSGVKTPAR